MMAFMISTGFVVNVAIVRLENISRSGAATRFI
jgi:multidrug efflux pump subunit AcrB